MAERLWTAHFTQICVASMLLFASLFMLFPVLPVEMANRLGVPVAQTGVIYIYFALGMLLIGPFQAYLIDAYKRQTVCMFSFALMIAATIGYYFVTKRIEFILLSMVQGACFGIASTAGITLGIDITGTTLRNDGNVSFSWMARFGIIAGIAIGVWFDSYHSFKDLLTVSVITGAVGLLILTGIYVPFRAPMVTRLFSFDRFLLCRGVLPIINIVLVAFVPGLLIPVIFPSLNSYSLGSAGFVVPFFLGICIGSVVSLTFKHLLKLKNQD